MTPYLNIKVTGREKLRFIPEHIRRGRLIFILRCFLNAYCLFSGLQNSKQ